MYYDVDQCFGGIPLVTRFAAFHRSARTKFFVRSIFYFGFVLVLTV